MQHCSLREAHCPDRGYVLERRKPKGGSPAGAGPGGTPPDMAALLSSMGMGGRGMGGVPAPSPVADPETAYATQIQQLENMGFWDCDSNLRVRDWVRVRGLPYCAQQHYRFNLCLAPFADRQP